MAVCDYNFTTGEAETGRSWGLVASQPSLVGEPEDSVRGLISKHKVVGP